MPELFNENRPIVTRENSKTRPVRVPEIVDLEIANPKSLSYKYHRENDPEVCRFKLGHLTARSLSQDFRR